jgi:hypothetical protein
MGPAIAGNPFSLHKFKGKCALPYELGVDIIKGNLVWMRVLTLQVNTLT